MAKQKPKEMDLFKIISFVMLLVFLVMIVIIYINIKNLNPSVACEICQSKGNATCYRNGDNIHGIELKIDSNDPNLNSKDNYSIP